MSTIEEKIAALSKELETHNYNYYVKSQPTISDYDFDQSSDSDDDLVAYWLQDAKMAAKTQKDVDNAKKSDESGVKISQNEPQMEVSNPH